MRQKTYYDNSEITSNLYTTGSEWMFESGTEYIGLYHRYITGEVYTEATWNPQLSVKLIAYEDITTSQYQYKKLNPVRVQYDSPAAHVVNIRIEDINRGYITRYFIQRTNTSQCIEIDESTYTKWQRREIDPYMYTAVSITWYIAGDLAAVREANTQQIQLAQLTVSNIRSIISDAIQYYTDNTYTQPADINRLDS